MNNAITLGCSVCDQAKELANADFCPSHARALQSVRQAYEVWTNAFGSIEPADFLNSVAKLPGTGRSAKEIVGFLQQHPEKWK